MKGYSGDILCVYDGHFTMPGLTGLIAGLGHIIMANVKCFKYIHTECTCIYTI